jgi:hypothetical protein
MSDNLDPEIQAIVKSQLKKDERVYHWHQDQDEIVVRLIADLDASPAIQELIKTHGRGGGGRTMYFRRKNETWEFFGFGGWRS